MGEATGPDKAGHRGPSVGSVQKWLRRAVGVRRLGARTPGSLTLNLHFLSTDHTPHPALSSSWAPSPAKPLHPRTHILTGSETVTKSAKYARLGCHKGYGET